tara:strand:+ start:349 stop:975 length:627 start_codon:yes stop_codon:yes gene_type:complete
MKLKVCGMRSPKNISNLAKIKPDYIGLIFWENSKRFVFNSTPDLGEPVKKVGVFVNASLKYIKECIEAHKLKGVQLHGNESPKQCSELKEIDVEVIKAFAIQKKFDFSEIELYEPVCDYFLFDAKGELPGGNGLHFDWTLLKDYPSKKPFFLSGGIGPNDCVAIASIIKLNLPLYAVDVNSKFEIEPGFKNIQSIKKFKSKLYNEISG